MGGFSGVCPQRLQAESLPPTFLMFLLWNKWLCIPSGSVPRTPAVGPLSVRGQLSHATLCAQHTRPLALNGEIVSRSVRIMISVCSGLSSWCDPVKVPLLPPPPAWYVVIGELPCLNFSISQGEIAKQHSFM